MKRLLLFLTLSSLLAFPVSSQTYSDDIAQIMYDNCSSCHHPGGIAPFSLMSYTDMQNYSGGIYDAIAQDRMPPWPPNENYTEFSHSRAMDENEKTMVLDWLSNGMPEGNPANTPAPPVYNSGSILGAGDLEVQMPTYMSKASSAQDDYVCFSIPSGLLENRKIKAMEVVPGNTQIVHHCLVYIDEDGTYVSDTTSGQCTGPTTATLVGGYTPGSTPLILPSGTQLKLGMELPAGSNIVFAMHYPTGSYGEFDSTKVIFHFYDENETGIRDVIAAPVLQNWSFQLPPNELTAVEATNNQVPTDFSILSVFPHMHLLGRYIKSYALDPQQDTIRFIEIPDWDFHWQDFYIFKNLVKVPQNSTLRVDALFDNTVNNLHNPNDPPVMVYPGTNTADEMLLVYFHFLPYLPGDENYDLEEMMTLSLNEFDNQSNPEFSIHPNPFNESLTISIEGTKVVNTFSAAVYDQQGKIVKTLTQGEIFSGLKSIDWNGSNENGQKVKNGMYYISILLNGEAQHKKVIKM
jgi:hypothetical protein